MIHGTGFQAGPGCNYVRNGGRSERERERERERVRETQQERDPSGERSERGREIDQEVDYSYLRVEPEIQRSCRLSWGSCRRVCVCRLKPGCPASAKEHPETEVLRSNPFSVALDSMAWALRSDRSLGIRGKILP